MILEQSGRAPEQAGGGAGGTQEVWIAEGPASSNVPVGALGAVLHKLKVRPARLDRRSS